jgi:uncharacterized protein YndB with AHSA1/START domain
MSELTVEVRVGPPPGEVFGAIEDSVLLRRWFGAPPGGYRLVAEGDATPGEAFRVQLLDAQGTPFAQVGRVLEVMPGEGLVLEMGWEGGPLAGETTRATLKLHAHEGGTRVEVRQGPFQSQEALVAHQGYWEACLGRLARVVAGEAVPCLEEFWDEAEGYTGPLGVAAYAVLAGLREAGAPAEDIARVEELLYTHLPRLSEETAEILSTLVNARVRGTVV